MLKPRLLLPSSYRPLFSLNRPPGLRLLHSRTQSSRRLRVRSRHTNAARSLSLSPMKVLLLSADDADFSAARSEYWALFVGVAPLQKRSMSRSLDDPRSWGDSRSNSSRGPIYGPVTGEQSRIVGGRCQTAKRRENSQRVIDFMD